MSLDRLLYTVFGIIYLFQAGNTQNCSQLVFSEDNLSHEFLTIYKESLVFVDFGITSNKLWLSNGNVSESTLLFETTSGSIDRQFKTNQDLLFFEVRYSVVRELWRTDGTIDGTLKLRTFTQVGTHIFFDDKMYFSAAEEGSNSELWVTDGTSEGTVLLMEIEESDFGSTPGRFHEISQNQFIFTAFTIEFGREIWISDGTLAGTEMLLDATHGRDGGFYTELINHNGFTYFNYRSNTYGRELWRTDGTTEGTLMIKDIFPGRRSSSPYEFQIVNDRLLYYGRDDINGFELRFLDPISLEEDVLVDAFPGPLNSNSNTFIPHIASNDSLALFFALSPESGTELWVTDGTKNNTKLLCDLSSGPEDTGSIGIIQIEDLFIASVNVDGIGFEVLTTDGTKENTNVIDFLAGPDGSVLHSIIETKDGLVFIARDSAGYYNPWFSSKDLQNSFQLCQLDINSQLDSFRQLVVGNKVFYVIPASNSFENDLFFFDLDSIIETKPIPTLNEWCTVYLVILFLIVSLIRLKKPRISTSTIPIPRIRL